MYYDSPLAVSLYEIRPMFFDLMRDWYRFDVSAISDKVYEAFEDKIKKYLSKFGLAIEKVWDVFLCLRGEIVL